MVLPALLVECLRELHNVYPQSLIHTWVLKPMLATDRSKDGNSKGASKVMGILALAFFFEATTAKVVTFLLSGLAGTLRIRVEASLLPDDIQTIVPMDRNFGLKSNRLRHRGITILEAWQTLTWSAAWRIFKIYAKSYLISIVLSFATALFWGAIAFATPGWDLQTAGGESLSKVGNAESPIMVI